MKAQGVNHAVLEIKDASLMDSAPPVETDREEAEEPAGAAADAEPPQSASMGIHPAPQAPSARSPVRAARGLVNKAC